MTGNYEDDEDDAVVWMLSAAASLPVLLQPMMKAASKKWFDRPDFSAETYADKGNWVTWLLHGWLSWAEDGKPPTEEQEFELGGVGWVLSFSHRSDWNTSQSGLNGQRMCTGIPI